MPQGCCDESVVMNPLIRNKTNLTLIGAPGSGKGTYGKKLAKSLRAILLSVGDLLRDHVQRKTTIGVEAAEAQQRGELVSDSVVAKAIFDHLKIHPREADNHNNNVGVVFDGYPRTLSQARLISPAINDFERDDTMEYDRNLSLSERIRVHYAVSLEVPDNICLKKALGRRTCTLCKKEINVCDIDEDGYRMPPILPEDCPPRCDVHWKTRQDDTREIIMRRIHHYRNSADPLLSFYEKKGTLIKFHPYNGVDDLPTLERIIHNAVGHGEENLYN